MTTDALELQAAEVAAEIMARAPSIPSGMDGAFRQAIITGWVLGHIAGVEYAAGSMQAILDAHKTP